MYPNYRALHVLWFSIGIRDWPVLNSILSCKFFLPIARSRGEWNHRQIQDFTSSESSSFQYCAFSSWRMRPIRAPLREEMHFVHFGCISILIWSISRAQEREVEITRGDWNEMRWWEFLSPFRMLLRWACIRASVIDNQKRYHKS